MQRRMVMVKKISFNLDEDVYKQLKKLLDKRNTTMTEFLSETIVEYLRKQVLGRFR